MDSHVLASELVVLNQTHISSDMDVTNETIAPNIAVAEQIGSQVNPDGSSFAVL
jgi:hypothetical protein